MRISQSCVRPDGSIARGRFDALTIFLHWTSSALVLFQLASGWAMAEFDARRLMPDLLFFHASAGALVWAVSLMRLVWRQTLATFPPFPSNFWRITRWAAQANEYALYAMLLIQPMTGLAQEILRGRHFQLLIWSVPPLLPHSAALAQLAGAAHRYGALAFAGLIGAHAMAALGHHYIFRDDVLELMAPVLRRSKRHCDMRAKASVVAT